MPYFENDEKMPLYGTTEFETGLRYLELLVGIADAKKYALDFVATGYENLSLKDANARVATYREAFHQAVQRETAERHPETSGHEVNEIARKRAHDILASLMDTSYVASDFKLPETGRF